MAATNMNEDGIAEAQHLVQLAREEADSWKRDHKLAMSCMKLEMVITSAIFLAKKMIRYSSAYLVKPPPAHLPKPVMSEKVRSSLTDWLDFAKDLELGSQEFENLGYEVEGAGQLRKVLHHVNEMLSPSNPASPWGVFPVIDLEEVEKAEQEYERQGKTRTYSSDEAFARARAMAQSKTGRDQ